VNGPQAPGLGARTLRGAGWAYASYVAGRVLVLVTTVILARLLSPQEFGLVALALVFTALLATVKDLGVTQSLIVDHGDGEARASTACAFTIAAAILLWAVTAALGPVAAAFFDEPRLTVMLAVLGANFPLRALGATHYALAQRRLDFKARAAAETAEVLVRGATGMALALAGVGAYSLVVGYLAGSVALTAALWLRVPFRPSRREMRREHLSSLVRLGGTLTAVDVIAAFNSQVDNLFVGRVLGAGALGLYAIAFRLPELLIRNLALVAGQVLYPGFAALDRAALGRGFVVALRLTAAVALPVSVGLAVMAEPFVRALFGEQWLGAVDAMRVLAVFGLATALNVPAGSAYKATGRAGTLLMLSIPRGLALVGALLLFAGEGIVAVALCQTVTSLVAAVAATLLASRLLDVRNAAFVHALWAPVVAAAVLAGVLLGVDAVLDSWAALAAGVALGVSAYVGTMALIAPDVVATARGLRGAGRPAPAPDGAS
jgi:PST family polysaccharide transporter